MLLHDRLYPSVSSSSIPRIPALKLICFPLFYILLLTVITGAQVPCGYYDAAEGLIGYELKTALHEIIRENHVARPYRDIWGFFEKHDVKPDGTVWDIFGDSGFNFGTPQNGGNQDIGLGGNVEGEYFNREHSFPRSWFGGDYDPMFTDIIHIYPADKMVNNVRAAFVFANVNPDEALYISSNGAMLGPSITPGLDALAFEMPDDLKGDLARTYFYMATRYENKIADWVGNNPEGDLLLSGCSQKVFHEWALRLLFQWHINDPVSQKEIDRNNAAFEFQGNRNPFVDHPGWIQEIWGFEEEDLLGEHDCVFYDLHIYPMPVENNVLYIQTATWLHEITLYDLSGNIVQQQLYPSARFNTYGMYIVKPGTYILELRSFSDTLTKRIVVR